MTEDAVPQPLLDRPPPFSKSTAAPGTKIAACWVLLAQVRNRSMQARHLSRGQPPGNFGISQVGRPSGNRRFLPYSPMDDYDAIFDEIRNLFRQQTTPDLPLVPLFDSILEGKTTRQQFARFGEKAAKRGRSILYDTMATYALETKNTTLYWVLTRFRDYDVRRPGVIGPWQPVPEDVVIPDTIAFLGLEAFGLTMSL